jgi:DNA-binding NarL/FixJ family response regulator
MDIINHEADMRVVAEANDCPDTVRRYNEYRPDVTLIDLAMPGLGGIEVIRMIKASHPDARLIILTTFDTDQDVELVACRSDFISIVRLLGAGRGRFGNRPAAY